ncbi:unnamed protein product [Zymoseptoria tritici ST99CH_1A5]|uniref:F-box domain-containing protein n=1 Tax=Zymoseptoria tritici ST99CH_1A5 TaxID=1276529 RepID=A0A1Y6LVS5_ZYMTR|nr:unnamed protein product [Zymoseptoria tritici ST99CH_1A5]
MDGTLEDALISQTQLASPLPLDVRACFKVLETPELLEAILMELPADRYLLFSQRTCRRFRDTIRGSVYLQRKLFFQTTAMSCEDKLRCALPWHIDWTLPNPPNPILANVAISALIRDCNSVFMTQSTTFNIRKSVAVLRHKGQLWAMHRVQTEFLREKEAWPKVLTGPGNDVVLAWDLMRVTENDILPCRIFDLENTSLQNMYLVQPRVGVTVILYRGNPDATVMRDGKVVRRRRVSDMRSPAPGRPQDKSWTIKGQAYAKFDTFDQTIRQIFDEIDKIDETPQVA